MLTAARLEDILARLPEARVAVFGDYCLDVYWTIDMAASEISVETGKPTQPVREQRFFLGGAGTIVANLGALRVGCIAAFGVMGQDPFGECMMTLLRAKGVVCDGMIRLPATRHWQTLAYCKPYVGDEELSRLDMGHFNRLPDGVADNLLESLERELPSLDIVVVNQQIATGIHTPHLRKQLHGMMKRHPQATFIFDGRHHAGSYPCAWVKINAHEALRLTGKARPPLQQVSRNEVIEAADVLHARAGCRPVFVTYGARGCVVRTAQGVEEIPGLRTVGPIDPVGAGDSFLAGLSAGLAVGATPGEAAQLGNFAARVTVTKLKQTGTATPEEVLAVGDSPDYVDETEPGHGNR